MQLIKKDDIVKVISGNHKGKQGKVLKILKENDRIIVEKINLMKKHTKPNKKSQSTGGIVESEGSIHISNVKLLCPRCNVPTKVQISKLDDNKKVRTCKKCKEVIDK
ncbi:50S ribosomal protein L24 [Candidatus Dependentiae bacterium]|nr:50S ribosomal protein L24 [Candidatus Dependentiae bacterium]